MAYKTKQEGQSYNDFLSSEQPTKNKYNETYNTEESTCLRTKDSRFRQTETFVLKKSSTWASPRWSDL